MFNKELADKIDSIIKEKLPIIYDFDFDGIVMLYGGTIKNVMMGTPIHDLDFLILTQGKCQIIDFIRKFKLKYYMNAGGGYKVVYNNFSIDMNSYNDLLETGIYDIDMLFYDINKHMFISCGAISAIENRTITEVNDEKSPLYSNKMRLKKLIKFVKFATHSDKRVKVKQNKILWEFKMLKRKFKSLINKTINGNFRKCFRFLNGCKKEFSLIVLFGILMVLISIVFPALSGKVVSGIMLKDYKEIFIIIVWMTVLKVMSIIISYFFSKLYYVVRKKMIFNIRKDVAKCVLNFELDNFSDNNRGTFIDKLRSDPNEIVRCFNNIKDILLRGVGNFGSLAYIFYLDYRIGLVLLFFMLVVFKIRITGIRKRNTYRKAYYYEQERYTGVLGEMINGVNDIKSLDLKDNYMKRAEESFELVGENEFMGDYYRNFYNKLANFVQFVSFGIVMLLGLFLVQKNLLSTSSLIIIFMYNSSVFSFLERLGKLVNLFADLNVSCYRIFNLLDNNYYVKEVFGNKYSDKCSGKIEFDNVCFRYRGKIDEVLNQCSFTINSNETIALVGKSGTGKTTILNLIARLYNTDSGTIRIDDTVINEYSEAFIRDNVSIISQSPYLFDMSIKDNLKLVKEDITDEDIKRVCKLVCMDDFIETLPNKYNTVIGEGGVKLSGGQKQRLGIARALIKDTKIILLDEITSALDNDTGSIIKEVIKNIQKDHTIIIVTHELSMIKDCSRILVLDNGTIIGDGTHKELIKNNDIYKKLYKIK